MLSFGLISTTLQDSTSNDPTRALRMAIKRVCEVILPEAIGLTDAFGFTDWELDRSFLSMALS